MEDLPVGSEIILNVVETKKEQCNGCFFDEICTKKKKKVCGNFKCVAIDRKDGKNVQFKRVK